MEGPLCQSPARFFFSIHCLQNFWKPSPEVVPMQRIREIGLWYGRRLEKCGRTSFNPQNSIEIHVEGKGFDVGKCVSVMGMQPEGQEDSNAEKLQTKVCLRCGEMYRDEENNSTDCKYHGHMTGDQGLYALAPPHQGIDGEWSEASGVIVYKWNTGDERLNTGNRNWKKRWTCCGVYDIDAPPCHSGRHVSYDDGATRF